MIEQCPSNKSFDKSWLILSIYLSVGCSWYRFVGLWIEVQSGGGKIRCKISNDSEKGLLLYHDFSL